MAADVPAHGDVAPVASPPSVAAEIFGERLPAAVRYAEHLATTGVERGLIGPRETERLWDRHILNCAVVKEPLALARPDLHVVLVEPLARRVDWLTEVIEDLDLPIQVQRGRAEETEVRRRWEGADVVTARAVAPLARLAGWALPLLRRGGRLVAVKGASAEQEIARDAVAVRKAGGGDATVVRCGEGLVEVPSTVVLVERTAAPRAGRPGRRREQRS